jgi:serine/threonine protein kinase
MEKFWDYPEDIQIELVALQLSKYGSLIGKMSSPHSSIFTFDSGPQTSPRYTIAKGIQVKASMSVEEKRKFFARSLCEVNNAYAVCHHPLIHNFSDVQILYGMPFILSRKRDATLRDLIADAPLSELEALSIAAQIVHALVYCAKKGIVCHQDLKPENVFIDLIRNRFSVTADCPLRYRTYIADFELANAYLILRHPYGSRPYMAPEQYGNSWNDPLPDFSRTDVFAIGVILFEMLTGGLHPVGEHTSLIWPIVAEGKSRKWQREDPWKQWLKKGAPIPNTDKKFDSEILSIIENCLKTDIDDRFSKEALEAQLLGCLRHLDRNTFETLLVTLNYFDEIAAESEEGGWPYYEDRVEKLNEAFSDSSPL